MVRGQREELTYTPLDPPLQMTIEQQKKIIMSKVRYNDEF